MCLLYNYILNDIISLLYNWNDEYVNFHTLISIILESISPSWFGRNWTFAISSKYKTPGEKFYMYFWGAIGMKYELNKK